MLEMVLLLICKIQIVQELPFLLCFLIPLLVKTHLSFGVYPPDAYFCANNTKLMNFPAVDPDGDSLVYSLVDPLNSSGNSNGTSAGSSSGTYPFYTACQWAPGYNINNIVGGNPPMAIDPASGLISATPLSLVTLFLP